ncbi:MAG: hypothetical protein ACM3Q2_06855 [Syntrophothermus sp.]
MNGKKIKKAIKKTFKVIDNVNWTRAAGNASSVAGAVGGAIALARASKRKTSIFRSRRDKIMRPVRISAASIAILAGGLKLLNDNMPGKTRRSLRRTMNNAGFLFRIAGH